MFSQPFGSSPATSKPREIVKTELPWPKAEASPLHGEDVLAVSSKSNTSASSAGVAPAKYEVTLTKSDVAPSKREATSSKHPVEKASVVEEKRAVDLFFDESKASDDIFKPESKPTSSAESKSSKKYLEEDIFDSSTWKTEVTRSPEKASLESNKDDLFQTQAAKTSVTEKKKHGDSKLNNGEDPSVVVETESSKGKKTKKDAIKFKDVSVNPIY